MVSGVVDTQGAAAVRTAVRMALDAGPRVELDVRAVESWDGGAIRGLAECAGLGPGVEILMRGARPDAGRAGC